MKHIYKWLVGLLLFFTGSYAIGQNVSFDINAACTNSTLCNPFVNDYTCGTVTLRTTHGSPKFYSKTENNTTIKLIELRATISQNQNGTTNYSEGFTLKYSFKKGGSYTIRVKYIGIPHSYPTAGGYPQLIADLVSNPPRKNESCNLGLYPFYADEVNDPKQMNVLSNAATGVIQFQPAKDYAYLWLYSNPVRFEEVGSAIYSIEIIDNAGPTPSCYPDANFDFCSKTWNGSADVRAVNPITLGCDAFKSASAPGAGAAFVRRFTAPSITLSPDFIGSASDPSGAVRTLKIVPSADPCNQALRVDVSPIGNVQTVVESETPLLENINIYPSPSRGLVNIHFNSSELMNAQITVTDQSGRVVYQMQNKSENNLVQLHLEHLSNGIYFIKVNAKNKLAVKKLLINK